MSNSLIARIHKKTNLTAACIFKKIFGPFWKPIFTEINDIIYKICIKSKWHDEVGVAAAVQGEGKVTGSLHVT